MDFLWICYDFLAEAYCTDGQVHARALALIFGSLLTIIFVVAKRSYSRKEIGDSIALGIGLLFSLIIGLIIGALLINALQRWAAMRILVILIGSVFVATGFGRGLAWLRFERGS